MTAVDKSKATMTTSHGAERKPRFRLAIIGTGLIARNAHLPTALSLPEIEVKALVDPIVVRARELAREYGLDAMTVADAREIMGELDGAIIATPNHVHRQVAEPLLEAGISTLIEKPLATTVEDGRAILAAAGRGQAQVAVGYYQRFLDAPRLLDRLLNEGFFGRVTRFFHQYGTSGGWPSMSSYTLRRESIGGGVLVVTGTHFLDRMLHTWGTPDEVELVDDSCSGPEAHCEGTVRYTTGPFAPLEGLVRYSKSVPLPAGLVLETERGTVVLRDGLNEQITLIPMDRPDIRMAIADGKDPAFDPGLSHGQRMLRDFVAACRRGAAPEVDGAQALASLELLKRFYGRRRKLRDDWTSDGLSA
jgi:predicted dehydrogenase